LPRDLEFDDQNLMEIFARTFKLMDESGKKIDQTKLERFADEWRSTMVAMVAEHDELVREAAKMIAAQNQPSSPSSGPSNQGQGNKGGGGAGSQ